MASRADELNPVTWTVMHGYLVDQRNAADIIRALETERDQLKRERDEARREIVRMLSVLRHVPGEPEPSSKSRAIADEKWPGTGAALFPEEES